MCEKLAKKRKNTRELKKEKKKKKKNNNNNVKDNEIKARVEELIKKRKIMISTKNKTQKNISRKDM